MANAHIGQLCAPTTIVDAVLPADDLTVMEVTIRDLVVLSTDATSAIQWLAWHGLICNELCCKPCNIAMSLQCTEQAMHCLTHT